VALAVLASLSLARESRAQGYDEGRVPVALRGEVAPLWVDMYPPDAKVNEDLPIARCTTPCVAHLWRGRYRLFVHETPETNAGSRVVDIETPGDLVVHPRSPSMGPVGLTLGIAGPVAAIAGIALLLGGGCGGCSQSEPSVEIAGAGLLLGGLVATPIGWVMFGRSRHPGVSTKPLELGALSKPELAEARVRLPVELSFAREF
jgi:hypothetical protein